MKRAERTGKTDYLARVRRAIAAAPVWPRRPPSPAPAFPAWDAEERVDRFTAALSAVGGHVYRPADDAGVCAQVVDLVKSQQARRLVWVPSTALQDLGVEEALKRAGCELRSADFAEWIGPDGDEDNARAALRQFFASADMAISGASYAIADTGTLVLTAGRANPRSATNLPPQHVAVIRPGQIVSTLVDLVPQLKVEAARASALTLITGPSRTSDIEQISTVGVHGPIELHVVIRP